MKHPSPRSIAYLARQAAESRHLAARNDSIIKALKRGTSTTKELSLRHGLQVQSIRTIFAKATGRPAPYDPRASQVHSDYRLRSTAYLVKRARAIVAARKRGATYQSLADRFGVTPERIRMLYVVTTRRQYVAKLLKREKEQVWAK